MTGPTPEPTTPAEEVKLLGRLVALLDKADRQAQARSVAWLAGRYGQSAKDAE